MSLALSADRVAAVQRVDINVTYGSHNEFLHQCYLGNVENVTKMLQSSGPEQVNIPDPVSKTTPLHEAAGRGLDEIVKILLVHSANVYAQDCNGDTAVHRAIRGHHDKSAQLILIHSANLAHKPVDVQKNLGVIYGKIPVDVATKLSLSSPMLDTSSVESSDTKSNSDAVDTQDTLETASTTSTQSNPTSPPSESSSTSLPPEPTPSEGLDNNSLQNVKWPLLLWDVANLSGETPAMLAKARGGLDAHRYAQLETSHRAIWNSQARQKLGLPVDEEHRANSECCETCTIA